MAGLKLMTKYHYFLAIAFTTTLVGCMGESTSSIATSPETSTLPMTNTASTVTTPSTPTATVITDDIQECTLNEEFRELAINIVNQIRAESRDCGSTKYNAAQPVVWNSLLETTAVAHSNDMASRDFFSHTGSDNSSVGDRVSNAGYVWSQVAENISAGRLSMQDTINALVSSPGHCANIMNPNYVEMALACTQSNTATYGVYWTQVFARQY